MRTKIQFLPGLLLPFSLSLSLNLSCVSGHEAYYRENPCENFTLTLGENHQCTSREGGALDEFEIRRELTSRVISERQLLPHKEVGQRVLVFQDDGTYEARKLHFTQYWIMRNGIKHFLVYAEDSRGRYSIEKDGTILIDEPDLSTCRERQNGGEERISAHVDFVRRVEPYSSTKVAQTRVAFNNDGWLKDFHGYDYWNGEAKRRADVQWPEFPKDLDKPMIYRFQGFHADIHYGCLDKGFAEFRGNDQIYQAEEFRFEEGVEARQLKAGTRLRTDP